MDVNIKIDFIGVCTDTNVIYQAFWKKRPMNCKFDQCVLQKDVMS